jgi:hypothetical protein
MCIAAVALVCMIVLWHGGYFYIIDKSSSPDETVNITVYDKALIDYGFSFEDATSIIVKDSRNIETRICYEDAVYQGIWWAPDSEKYVISFRQGDQSQLVLTWLKRNSSSNLTAYLSMGVEMSELAEYELRYDEDPLPEVEYQFLQWSLDSSAMLIYYSFTDTNDMLHSGYFWYDCEDGTVYAPFELDGGR